MVWALANWKIILTFILTAGVSIFLHSFLSSINAAKQAEAIESAKLSIVRDCQAKMQISNEVSNEYQSKISTLNSRVNKLKRMYDNAKCLPVTNTTSRSDATSTRGELSRQSGIRADWLIDLGSSCEEVRLKAKGLQDFIKRERE